MDNTNARQLLEQERHETMVKLVYDSQAAYAELEASKAAYAAIKRYRFLKRRNCRRRSNATRCRTLRHVSVCRCFL